MIVPDLVAWLKDEPGHETSYAYQTIMNHTYKEHTEKFGKSMAMRLLIHYVGDFHQPLHCSTLVDDAFPVGDRGGNSFKVQVDGSDIKELHAVWDSVGLEFLDLKAMLPFSDADWATYGDTAQRYRHTYTIEDADAKNLDFTDWAAEDFYFTAVYVYTDLIQGEKLSHDYIEVARSIAERQVLLGGLRLANLLKSLKLGAEPSEFIL